MANLNVNTSFIAEKVTKIRFCPEQLSENVSFLTGGCFGVKFWKIIQKEDLSLDDMDMGCDEYQPKSIAKIGMKDEVTGMEFVDYNNAAVTSGDGSLSLVYINRDREEDNLQQNFQLKDLHAFGCTDLSVLEEDCVTVGEDGAFNVISCVTKKVVKSNKNADSAGISCCSFVGQKELLTGNNLGVVKVFNLQENNDKPVASLTVACEDEKKFNRVSCLCYHPTQIHVILAGTEEGSITIFDLRQPTMPVSYLSAHTDTINEIGFHRSEVTKLFTAAENGELWQWQQNTFPNLTGFGGVQDFSTENPWLNGERAKNSINVTTLVAGSTLAINSFDSYKNKVIAAGDNEAIYMVETLY